MRHQGLREHHVRLETGTYPDVMQIENARFSAFFKKPVALPEYHWDYARRRNYPDWGNAGLPRSVVGVLEPATDKFAVTPSITDTRPIETSCTLSTSGDSLEIAVALKTPAAKNDFPLAVGHSLPLEAGRRLVVDRG